METWMWVLIGVVGWVILLCILSRSFRRVVVDVTECIIEIIGVVLLFRD